MTRSKSRAIVLGALLTVAMGLPASAAPATASLPAVRSARFAPHLPAGATALGPLPADQPVAFSVVLAPSHPVELQALLAGQRDPSSPMYRHYLAPGQFRREFGPGAQQVDAVTAWLQRAGLRGITVNGPRIDVRTSSGEASRAFGISLERYRTADRRQSFFANQAPLVPGAITSDIAAFVGLTDSPAARPHLDNAPGSAPRASAAQPNADGLTPCSAAVTRATASNYYTPDQVGALYGVGNLLAQGQSGSAKSIALVELAPHSAANTNTYKTCFGLQNPVNTVLVDGGGTPDSNGSNGTLEANVDIEEAATQSPGATIVSYEGPNTDIGEFDVYQRIVNDDSAVAISTSWGMCEAGINSAFQGALGTLLAQAAAQGQTVVAASGDAGSEDCFAGGSGSTSLAVDSPADDPNVTGVGGTSLNAVGNEPVWNDCEGSVSFAACGGNGGAGGGGLSGDFARPAWQPLIAGSSCPAPLSTCRQVPDVAANAGVGEVFRSGGAWVGVGGTSIAAPKIAAIVADVNTACTARVGDLAPKLVTLAAGNGYGTALGDVTTGDNDLTRTHANNFTAKAGPDLATGVGVPIAAGWSCPQITALSSTSADPGTSITITGFALADASITFGNIPATVTARSATSVTVSVPGGSGVVAVRGANAIGTGTGSVSFTYPGTSTTTTSTTTTSTSTTTTTVPAKKSGAGPTTIDVRAYRTVASDGGIFDFGGAPFHGSTGAIHLNQPIVAMAPDATTGGYWFVARDGGVFGFRAPFRGSAGARHLSSPVVGMAATPDGSGYWLVTAGGSVIAFGGAHNFGSAPHPGAPIVGIARTPSGAGYWLAGRDGAVYAFGDARGYGSMAGTSLTQPIVGIAPDGATGGYWLVAGDGGIFGFHAPFFGSTGAIRLNQPIVGIAPTANGRGYWLVARDGGIFNFGNARFSGSMGGSRLNRPMVGLAGR